MPLERSKATELMDRASSGDDEAFGVLAAAHQDDLHRLALSQGLCAADAAEVCQEAMMRAYRRLDAWRRGGDARAYLAGIAVNVAREFRRRKRGERLGLDPAIVEAAMSTEAPAKPSPADGVDVRRLAEALELLPPRQREAVTCRYLNRMSVAQTAKALGCAEGTVKAAVFAALGNLRKILGPYEA
jgi:RNA polymerase sigma-70 factor (ECF subfamily)